MINTSDFMRKLMQESTYKLCESVNACEVKVNYCKSHINPGSTEKEEYLCRKF